MKSSHSMTVSGGLLGRLLPLAVVITALGGCSTLHTIEPDTARVGVQHLSSITQHFGNDPTNVGNDAVTVGAEWAPTKHTYIEVQDAYILGGAHFAGGQGHEFFEARAGYQFNLK